ncbi:hypothetical protein D3C86_2193640 [compost metagenome]
MFALNIDQVPRQGNAQSEMLVPSSGVINSSGQFTIDSKAFPAFILGVHDLTYYLFGGVNGF